MRFSFHWACDQRSLILRAALTDLKRKVILFAGKNVFSLPGLNVKFLIVVFMTLVQNDFIQVGWDF
jgi:hypothetical protein